jgi:hypothetical protein
MSSKYRLANRLIAMTTIYHLNLPDISVPPTPAWLKQRGGELRGDIHPDAVEVWIEGQPLYRLEVRPAKGHLACAIINMTNGTRLDDPQRAFATPEQALADGLEQLRHYLGW